MNRRSIIYASAVGVSCVLGCAAGAAADAPPTLQMLEEAAVRSAIEQVRPAVVRIDLIGSAAADGDLQASGPTSGLIVTAEGHVLTSTFGFATLPASILVTLDDGRQLPATLVATDHSRQLVLLKLEGATELPVQVIAPLSETNAGQWAIAVGRALSADGPNVSVGIVSAVGRLQGRALQIDASISPANYGGPLIDISGRILGVLTPLAPDSSEGASGTDWYDSGIGFAVPLADYKPSLIRLQSGEDLHRGLIGIAFASDNAMESPAAIGSVRPRGPAAAAGLRSGDRIVAIDRVRTDTQAAFRRQLGRFYANDSIVLAIEREKSSFEVNVTLVSELEPFRHAALGIRPRDASTSEAARVEVAHVVPGGPASAAKIEAGDMIERIDDQIVSTSDDLAAAVQLRTPGETVKLNIARRQESIGHSVTLAERSAELYTPENGTTPGEQASAAPPGETREFNLPGYATPCPLYVPSDAQDARPLGLLVVLQSGSDAIDPEALRRWQESAEQNRLMVAMPHPQESRGWSARDIDYVRELMRTLVERHDIDRRRVAIAGPDVSNPITLTFWLANRELVRGLVLGSAELPAGVRLPENEADRPCLVLVTADAADRKTVKLIEQFHKVGFAAATGGDSSPEIIAGWVDSLDRM